MNSFQLIVGCVLVLNLCVQLAPVFNLITHHNSPDDVCVLENRLRPLKAALPVLETVGYVTDSEKTKGELFSLADCRRFYMVSYALAPNIVVHGAEPKLVVGSFTSADAAQKTIESSGLTVIRKFDDRLFLLHNSRAR